MEKRKMKISVISDTHLGTYGCRSKELYSYLRSIKPEILILNGDIIDIWQFRKSYFPKYHLKVVKQIFSMAAKGTTVYYLTGNHDEMLRKFTDQQFGNIHLLDKLELKIDEKKMWFFHGDVFDASIHSAKWLAKLGGWSYDFLILINNFTNWCLEMMGKERFSFSKKIKNSVKKAVRFIGDFEQTAAELAIDKGYDYVACGHIHQPQIKSVEKRNGTCIYLNSGDWIENLSALEYNHKNWSLYFYEKEIEEEFEEADSDIQKPDLQTVIKKLINNEELLSI